MIEAQDILLLADDRADFELFTTDMTRQFVSWKTRNTYARADLILVERCIETFDWEDQVELTDFLNARDRVSQ